MFVKSFASYKHDCWVFDCQSEGWSHGLQMDEERHKHPNIKPFRLLSQEVAFIDLKFCGSKCCFIGLFLLTLYCLGPGSCRGTSD